MAPFPHDQQFVGAMSPSRPTGILLCRFFQTVKWGRKEWKKGRGERRKRREGKKGSGEGGEVGREGKA